VVDQTDFKNLFSLLCSCPTGNDLYSATYINFLGSEPVVLRSSNLTLRTEFKSSWLRPNFVYMDFVGESFNSPEGDDDKVYLFFSENAMEYDSYRKVTVSRVARVCKGDMGGQRTLQRKWTSFLKARLDCSLPEPSLPPIVQDVFLLKHNDWAKSVFYAVFTPQSLSQVSAVCAYRVSTIRDIFNEGKFKTPVAVEMSHVKWVMYTGEVPVPRPGACINNAARKMGISHSLELPDKTLQFIRDYSLMHEAVRPLTGGPLLVKKGALLTQIVVDSVSALDGKKYSGQLYAGSEFGAVQVAVSNCSRHKTCEDCILARDPYCAWENYSSQCLSVRSLSPSSNVAFQSLQDFNPDCVSTFFLCVSFSCLANFTPTWWRLAGVSLVEYFRGLLILRASESDAGLYICDSVEQVKGREYNRTMAAYRLLLRTTQSNSGTVIGLTVAVAVLALLCVSLVVLFCSLLSYICRAI
uniref:Si:ch211-129c21.1 n=1 Tax=Gouania willdenowi TaxID=441366 RepID=A0A8C5G425_GOUWI